MKFRQFCAVFAAVLLSFETALIVITWIVTAAFPNLPLRSVLSNEGIRWFFGTLISNQANEILVCLILISFAVGALRGSGLWGALRTLFSSTRLSLQHQFAFRLVFAELLLFIVCVALLIALPHAVLLSVTGHLFPSPFSRSVIPVTSLFVVLASLTFGTASGNMPSLYDSYAAVLGETKTMAHILPVYFIIVEIYHTIAFVFNVSF